MSEPPPTSRRLEELDIEGRLDDTAQRAPRVRAKGVALLIPEITFPSRSVPPSVFVAAVFALGRKISPAFHTISATPK